MPQTHRAPKFALVGPARRYGMVYLRLVPLNASWYYKNH